MERHIRTIYLYLFALLGLVFVSIGAIRFIDMALRSLVFKQADAQERLHAAPPMPEWARPERLEAVARDTVLSAEERAEVRRLLQDYERWRAAFSQVDPVAARRARDASTSLALILVGLPLYLYHWRRIRTEIEERRAARARRLAAGPPSA